RVLRNLGLRPGDLVAQLLENHPRFFEAVWATQNNALYFTSLNTHLTAPEIAYILKDSGAKVLVTSRAHAAKVAELRNLAPGLEAILMMDGAEPGTRSYEAALAAVEDAKLPGERQGALMLYSSGTTGFPKGIRPALPDLPPGEAVGVAKFLVPVHGLSERTVYLSPAPLYHTAPLKWNMTIQMVGATSIVLESFDAEAALAAIERHRVTHAQLVPTMFVRMLKLPEEVRAKYDLGSLERVIHAAAPCPIEIKERMIEWVGPIVEEYYAGTESNGLCVITTPEWLERKGSVGRSVRGPVHIMDETGETELPPGEPGLIYFEGGTPFVYHGDAAKTDRSRNSRGWSTIGDIGYLDAAGYLYLTDRKDDVIISGGVNIYPQEAENLLMTHPKVLDVAVLGVPNGEFGEEVKAVVQPLPGVAPTPELAEELASWLEPRLATYKRPRSYDFVETLPRTPVGKLLKRVLRQQYWGDAPRPGATLADRISGTPPPVPLPQGEEERSGSCVPPPLAGGGQEEGAEPRKGTS
ncbi:MAG TPA: acyl-CoA synthetase, partial [Stellaceae bacterium]|nr:acyl-CoA synthetase [Stellaceae bacterium]